MASDTQQTRLIRKRKLHKKGLKRKVANRNNGTTQSDAKLFGDDDEK